MPTELPFFQIDAFAERPFQGNPAAVMPLDAWLDDATLQAIALENNLSETAFIVPSQAADAEYDLRWFTPATEVDMCGHATLATAHVLHTTGTASGTVRFSARCGILTTTAHRDGTLTMDFPTAPLAPLAIPPGLARALGAEPVSVHDTGAQIGDLLIELTDEATVRALAPDLAALTALPRSDVIVTAAAGDASLGYDFVSRGFFPGVGIDEDPVTGSAHTALAPFWSPRLGRDDLTGLQVSARSGRVLTSLRGDRTLLTGSAVTVIDGELLTAL